MVGGAWSLVLALIVLAPTLPAGYVLLRDMVFTPRQPLTPAALGLGSSLPRAVPVDAVLAAVTTVLPGMIVQKAVLLATLVLAGIGAALLVPTGLRTTRCAAASLYVWNAYLGERLLLGDWSLLVAYAALPWLARAALRLRSGDRRAAVTVVLLLGLCALTPGGGLLSALVVVPLLVWPGGSAPRGLRVSVTAALVFVNSPWWLPGALTVGAGRSSAAGVGAFAARAELPIGALGSLLGLGGAWNSQVVPGSRGLLPATIFTVLVIAAAAVGWRTLHAAWGRAAGALTASAAVGLALAWAGSAPVLSSALRWAVVTVPGAGLLRDGQRLVAPLALLVAVSAPLGMEHLATRLREPPARVAIGMVLVLAPLVVMPDLAWGAVGQLRPVAYPADWPAVRSVLSAHPPGPTSGDVVVLPWQAYRQFSWNADRTVLDPAPRYLDRTTVVADALVVGPVVVAGEDPRSRAVGSALATNAPAVRTLPPLGIGWLLVERGTPGQVPPSLLAGAAVVYSGDTLTLYQLGDGAGDGRGWGSGAVVPGAHDGWAVGVWGARAVLVADALVVLLLMGCCGVLVRSRRRAAATVASN